MILQLKNRQLPFWILTIAVLTGAIFSQLIKEGMFNDALLYTSVAKNLGNGLGTFWNPVFSETWKAGAHGTFHEQPPLVFGLLSLFFRVFGNGIYTERIYTAFTTLLSVFLIHKIWQSSPHKSLVVRKMSWLPVFFWVTFPVIIWSHRNMMCENTMEVFVLAAVFFICKAFYSNERIIWRLSLAGVCIFLAALSKGVPGLFPLAVVPFFWLIYRSFSFGKATAYTILIIAVVAAIFGIVMLNLEARNALRFYVTARLLGRINNGAVVSDRFRVMKELVVHLTVVLAVIGIVLGLLKRAHYPIARIRKKHVVFFFIVGLCGSVPLTLTLVQRGFYMTPAMPFFAIALSFILAPSLEMPVSKMKIEGTRFRNFLVISMALLVAAAGFTAFNAGKVGRDRDKIAAVKKLDTLVKSWVIVGVPPQLRQDWSLETYLMRYAEISVYREDDFNGSFYLSDSPEDSTGKKISKEPIHLAGTYYLYAKPGATEMK